MGCMMNFICNKRGVSLIYVLAVMGMLLVIAASVFLSASSNAGAAINAKTQNYLRLYSDSVHHAIKKQLFDSVSDEGKQVNVPPEHENAPQTLGGQILNMIYKKHTELTSENTNETINFSKDVLNEFDLELIPTFKDTNLTEAKIFINIVPTVRKETIYSDNLNINADVTVTLSAVYGGMSKISSVEYSFSGGFITNDFIIQNSGIWRFISYETT